MTIKAVRHYHRRGLLAEPPRDASGYRRYGAQHAIDLVKIKTLAEAGVPLARIKELLAADPDRFAAAIAEIDRDLRERAEELRRTRERLARLSAGDRLFVSAEVADFLDRLRELGVSQRAVQTGARRLDPAAGGLAGGRRPSGSPTSATRSAIRSSGPSTSSTTRRSTGPRTTRASTRWPTASGGGSPSGLSGRGRKRPALAQRSPDWSRRRSVRRRRP